LHFICNQQVLRKAIPVDPLAIAAESVRAAISGISSARDLCDFPSNRFVFL